MHVEMHFLALDDFGQHMLLTAAMKQQPQNEVQPALIYGSAQVRPSRLTLPGT